jgi:dihydrofolate reductase
MVSLDGFFEGPDHDLTWHRVDDEFDEFALEQLDGAAALVFGRVTYELMAGYWPGEDAARDDPRIAERMNGLPKSVFSRKLDRAGWTNTTLIRGDAAREMATLKHRSSGDFFLFGSADLAVTFTRGGLIDEYRLMMNPVLLGAGTPLFKGSGRLELRLSGHRTFANGNVLLRYQPAESLLL